MDFDSQFEDFAIDYALPKTISYDLKVLNSFCSGDRDCALIFYGGEPLLRVEDVRRIMDHVSARHFLIQTNGTLLHLLEPQYVNRLHTVLVSLDGDEDLTDFYRGSGVFSKIMENLHLIWRNGFRGELIARMTVMEQTDIYRQVRWLVENSEFPFSSVHWQLNAGFWSDFERRDFKRWVEQSYNPGIRRLVKFWVDEMQRKGSVLRLYPFLGVANSFLFGEKEVPLRCGGGWINYAIQTDGHIIPCPAMWGMRDYYLGHISQGNPMNLQRVYVGEPCTKCEIFNLCGGRCLYANVTKRWKDGAYKEICKTVHNLIEAVLEEIPRIKTLITNGTLKPEDFNFMKYNGCEIIP